MKYEELKPQILVNQTCDLITTLPVNPFNHELARPYAIHCFHMDSCSPGLQDGVA